MHKSVDLIYNKLKRPDIISCILDLEYKFFKKIELLEKEVALVKSILHLCNNTPYVDHYKSLRQDNQKNNISDRETRILESDASMLQYYSSIINVREKSSIYSNFVDDRKRYITT